VGLHGRLAEEEPLGGLARVLQKLGVRDRLQAVVMAYRSGAV
jgi:hypothetical protein